MTDDLVTPCGVLLGDPEPRSEEWFALRRKGITATDLPLMLDLKPKYGNALTVWLDKRGDTLDLDGESEAGKWGTLLEPVVAGEWSRSMNDAPIRRVGVLARQDAPWQRASLDYLVGKCPDGDGENVCGLEVKTRSAFVQGKWRNEIPDDVLAQVLWQVQVTGFDHMHVAVLFGGQKLSALRVDREAEGNPEIIALLVEAGQKLWDSVTTDERPEVDPSSLLTRILDALYSERKGEREITREVAADLQRAWTAASRMESGGKSRRTIAKSRIVETLEDAEILTVDGVPVLSYEQTSRAGYTVPPTTYRSVKVLHDVTDPARPEYEPPTETEEED